MTGIFRQKSPGNIILLIILGVCIKLPAFFHAPGPVVKDSDGIFYTGVVSFISAATGNSRIIFSLLAFVLNMVQAFALLHFINANRLMHKSNFLPGMAYVLISSFLPSFNLFSSNLLASVFLLAAFKLLFKSHNIKTDKNNIYNAALLIGIASLFFLPALLFVVWAFIAMAILRPFKLSEWVTLLLGITTPYYFFAAYLYLNDTFYIPGYFYHLSFLSSSISYSLWHAGALFLLLAPLLAGIYYMYANSAKMMVQVRKGWYLVIWYLLTGIAIALFDIEKTSENAVILLVPVAALHGYGYLNAELKPYSKTTFWITVLFIISSQLYSGIW